MMRAVSMRGGFLLALGLGSLGLAPCAFAAEAAGGGGQGLARALLAIVLGLLGCVGAGAVALVLRVILPGVAAAADASLARLRTGRLVVAGIVPLVGAALLARGVQLVGSPVLGGVYALVVVLPLALAVLLGAMAALPHLGVRVLRAEPAPSPLRAASVGGLVTGLAMVSWLLPPLGVALSVLLAGWFVGIGLGTLVRRPADAPPATEAGG